MRKSKQHSITIASMTELLNTINYYEEMISNVNPHIISKAKKEISFALVEFTVNIQSGFKYIKSGYFFIGNLLGRFNYSDKFKCMVYKYIDLSIYYTLLKNLNVTDDTFGFNLINFDIERVYSSNIILKFLISLIQLDHFIEIDDYKKAKSHYLESI